MSNTAIWIIIIGMGIITYLERASFFMLLGRWEMPALLTRSLRFTPAAVLSALVLPAVVYNSGEFDVSLGNLRLIAAVVASLVAWYTKNILLTIAAGMISLWVGTWLVG